MQDWDFSDLIRMKVEVKSFRSFLVFQLLIFELKKTSDARTASSSHIHQQKLLTSTFKVPLIKDPDS